MELPIAVAALVAALIALVLAWSTALRVKADRAESVQRWELIRERNEIKADEALYRSLAVGGLARALGYERVETPHSVAWQKKGARR